MIQIHNVATGEVIEREMTVEELAQSKADKSNAGTKATKEAADKAALLTKLGITEDEARLLLGGN
jgi:hypothetical protein